MIQAEADPAQSADAQDPQKAQDPQPAAMPKPPVPAPVPSQPPPDFEDRMARLIKSRVDALSHSLVDDRGKVLREAMTEDEALRNTIAYLPKYLQSDSGAEMLRDYLAGGKIPGEFAPRKGAVKSIETQLLEDRARVGREQSPVYAAVRDYVVDPLGNILPAALQVGTDVVVGAGRLAGVFPEGSSIDVKAKFHELTGTTRDELDAIAKTASVPAKIAQGTTEMVGTAYGFGAGAIGRTLGLGGKLVGSVGKALFGTVGQSIGHAAGVFGAYEGLVAEDGKRLEGTAKGLAAGALLGSAQQVASIALRKMFSSAVAALGPDERAAMDSLKGWASKNKLFQERGETGKAYEKRLVDSWIGAGLPGAPSMPARKLIQYAIRGGADAVGFSLIDQQFREDLLDAAWHGNSEKWNDVVARFGGNFLGAAALAMPLSSIVPWQRRHSVGKPEQPNIGEGRIVDRPEIGSGKIVENPPVDAEFSVQPKEPLALPAPKESRFEALTREQNAKLADQYEERWRIVTEGPSKSPQERYLEAAGVSVDNAIALGWRPREVAADRMTVEVPGTPHSYEVVGEVARPSQAMRESLGLPEEMPARDLVDAVERASLVDAMRTKAALPGDEVAVGMRATAGRGDEPAMVRRVVMGEVQESPLRPELEWKPAKDVETRGKDPIEPEQKMAVDALRDITERSDSLDPADRSLLHGAIDVLDTVSAQADQSVAETVSAMPQIVDAIAKGEPGAVKALAESLTTKAPERAIAEAKAKKKGRNPFPNRGKSLVTRIRELGGISRESWEKTFPGERHGEFRLKGVVRGKPKGTEARGTTGKPWDQIAQALHEDYAPPGTDIADTAWLVDALQDAANGRQTYRRSDYEKGGVFEQEKDPRSSISREEAERIMAMEWEESVRREMERTGLDYESAAENLAVREANNYGEAGFGPGPEMIRETAERAVDALEMGAATGANIVRRAWDAFQRSQIQRVEDMGMRDVAEMGRDATTATKRFQSRLDSFGLMDMRRQKRAELDTMQDLVGDGNGGFSDRYARAMDEATARHFGEAELSDAERKIVAMGRRVTLEAGRIAEELGVQTTDSNGKNPRPFTADPNRRVLVREYTPEMQEARIKRSGPLFDAMVSWLEKTYGWTPKEAADHFSDAMGLTSVDATEIRRSIPVVPTHLEVAGQGVVRVLESRPLEHAERLAFRNSQVMGARSVMPRNLPEPEKGARTFPVDASLEPLPPTAQRVVDKVLNEKGPDAAEAVARMVRSMHGMPIERQSRLFTPGEPGYHFVKVLDRLLGVRKAAALTMSFAANVAEPVSNAAHFGAAAVGAGYREAMRALVTGRFADLHREAVRDGFVADTKVNDPWKGDNAVETVENALKKIGDILTTPMRMSQDLNEMVSYVAARDRLAAMKQGQGTREDASALSLLGFKPDQVDAMLRGNGTPEQYERYQRNIVGKLAGGRSLRSAEKSDLAHSKGFNTLVWFTGFFQARSQAMDQLVRDIAQNKGDRAAAFGQMAKFAAATTVAGLAGNLFKQYLLGGSDGMADYLREQTADGVADTSKNLLGMFASGVVGGLGQPVMDAFTALGEPGDSADKWGKTALRLIGPLDATRQFADYVRSAFFDVDVPGYENKDLLGKTAKYLRDIMPAARAVHEGLFGISALAISEKNVALDNAQDSYYRWLRENKPQTFSKRGGTEEEIAWRNSMRSVMDLVASGKDWTDEQLVDAVIDAEAAKMTAMQATEALASDQGAKRSELRSPSELYKEARAAVVGSLRTRKMLPQPGEFTSEEVDSLTRHLGEKNLQTLRDFDEVLDLLAKRVKGANLRTQVRERQ